MIEGLLNIGFGNVVVKSRVIAIIQPDSLPIKKLKKAKEAENQVIDATSGKRTRAIIVTDSDHYILSAISVDTLIARFNQTGE